MPRHLLATAAIAAVLYVPGLGGFGLWDPHEFDAMGTPLARLGLSVFGDSELGARLPFALAGIALAVATYAWARGTREPSGAFVVAALTAASPLVLLQSRQLTSSIALSLGQVLIVLAASLGWRKCVRGAVACAVVGSAIAGWAGGLAVPLGAIGVALLFARWRVGVAVLAAAVAVFVFELPAPLPHPPEAAWSAAIEHVTYGAFPWIAVLPVAVANVRDDFDTRMAIAWSIGGFAVCTWLAMRGTPTHFTAMPALALLSSTAVLGCRPAPQSSKVGVDAARTALLLSPAAIAVAIIVAAILARDLVEFPDRLAGLHLRGVAMAHPHTHGWLRIAPLATAALIAASFACGRHRAHAITATCLAFGLALAHAWTPAVSRNASERHVFDQAAALRRPGESLVTLQIPERVARFYARDAARAAGQADIDRALARTERTFAIVPARALCKTSQAARALTVIESTDAFALVSNQHRPGEPRAPGLDDVIRTAAPTPEREVHATFADQLELIGVDMPSRARRGAAFEVTLYLRVLARPTRKWKVFMHFEASGGKRFVADHWPIHDRCPATEWNPGDIIVDTYTVPADRLGRARGSYALRTGLFVGANGNWTNMPVTRGDADPTHRVLAGSIDVH